MPVSSQAAIEPAECDFRHGNDPLARPILWGFRRAARSRPTTLSEGDAKVLRDRLRTLLHIRVERRTPPVNGKPRAGRYVVRGGNRMLVSAPMPDDLWYFLTLLGWREVPVPRDRRRYIDLPTASLELLVRTSPAKREIRYRQLQEQARRIAAARLAGRARAA